MSDVTGPISTLPGARHTVPQGAMCDVHPDRPATARIQGETDSFGCELHDCCPECRDEIFADMKAARVGSCDWCKCESTDLSDHRDLEEGMNGPVYRVCDKCRARELAQLDAYSDDAWGAEA